MKRFMIGNPFFFHSIHGVKYPGILLRVLWALGVSLLYLFWANPDLWWEREKWPALFAFWLVSFLFGEWILYVHLYITEGHYAIWGKPLLFRFLDCLIGFVLPFLLFMLLLEAVSETFPTFYGLLNPGGAILFMLYGVFNITYAFIALNHHSMYPHWLAIKTSTGEDRVIPTHNIVSVSGNLNEWIIRHHKGRLLQTLTINAQESFFNNRFDPLLFDRLSERTFENKKYPSYGPLQEFVPDNPGLVYKDKIFTPEVLERIFEYSGSKGRENYLCNPVHYYGFGLSMEVIVNTPVNGESYMAWPERKYCDYWTYSMYVSLKDGNLEFRFSAKQYLPFESCPITNDPVQVDIISKTVLSYFNKHDIRQRLKDGPVISPCMDDHPEAISQYLRGGNTDQFAQLLNNEGATCVFHEWDEIDLDYVLYSINGPLPHDLVEGDVEIVGDAQLIKLQFGMQQKIVGTNQLFQPSDLDALIQAASELLDPHFEIRWFIDIHRIVNNMCFVVLCPEAWEELESTFGEERIQREFQPITQSIFPFQQREALSRMNN